MESKTRRLSRLKQQIDQSLGAIKKSGLLNGQSEDFNIFRATGCSSYEIRHAAFFAWLFDTRQHDKAANFILHFFREVASDIGDHSLDEAFRNFKGNAASKSISVAPIFKKSESLTELVIGDRKRIDFAADVSVKGSRVARIVIEFKLKGEVNNDLDLYYKEVKKGCKKGDLHCFIIDFSGKEHYVENRNFSTVNSGALIEAVGLHADFLEGLDDDRYGPVGQATKQYYQLIKEHVGIFDQAVSDDCSRELLWNLWSPEMENEDVAEELDEYLEIEAEKRLVGDAADEAYFHRWWQLLSTHNILSFLKRESDFELTMPDGYTVNVIGKENRGFPNLRFKVSVVRGEWVGLVGKNKRKLAGKLYVRVYARAFHDKNEKISIKQLDKLGAGLLEMNINDIGDLGWPGFIERDGVPVSTAAFVESEGGFEVFHINKRNKINSLDRTLIFLVEVDENDLRGSVVTGKYSSNISNSLKRVHQILFSFIG
jgi:hypothetical protein